MDFLLAWSDIFAVRRTV